MSAEFWHSEETCSCGQMLRMRDDWRRMRTVFQHGDNPEAVLIVDTLDWLRLHEPTMRRPVAAWLREVHAYDAQDAPTLPTAPAEAR